MIWPSHIIHAFLIYIIFINWCYVICRFKLLSVQMRSGGLLQLHKMRWEQEWATSIKPSERVFLNSYDVGINERVPYNALLIQFSSWMGGDSDGMFFKDWHNFLKQKVGYFIDIKSTITDYLILILQSLSLPSSLLVFQIYLIRLFYHTSTLMFFAIL